MVLLKDILKGPHFNDLPRVHDCDLVTHFRTTPQIMRNHQQRCVQFLFQPVHHIQHLRLDRHIKRRCRFICNQYIGFASQRDGDNNALLHSPENWCGYSDARSPGMPQVPASPLHARRPLTWKYFREFQSSLRSVPLRASPGLMLSWILKDHGNVISTNLAQFFWIHVQNIIAADIDGTAFNHAWRIWHKIHDRERRGGLPAPVSPTSPNARPFFKVETDIVDRLLQSPSSRHSGRPDPSHPKQYPAGRHWSRCLYYCDPSLPLTSSISGPAHRAVRPPTLQTQSSQQNEQAREHRNIRGVFNEIPPRRYQCPKFRKRRERSRIPDNSNSRFPESPNRFGTSAPRSAERSH